MTTDLIRFALKEMISYIFHRLVGAPLRSESVRIVLKVSFKDRLDYYLHCHLHNPVHDHRYSQRPIAACWLGKPGLFEIAHTGTIFLDEITSTSQRVQRHLLRVLQEREVMRIGANRIVSISVRVIAASNDNIENEVYSGAFREDLFFRLNILRIKIPPLRERLEDIPLLLEHFINNLARQAHKEPFRIPQRHLVKLRQYPWPGNVRQLGNFAERLCLLSGDKFKTGIFDQLYSELVQYLPPHIHRKVSTINPSRMKEGHSTTNIVEESETIRRAIETSGHNKSEAARKLGISRTTLWKKLKLMN